MISLPFEDNYLTKLHTDLVNIPSVFPGEESIMLFLEGELKRIGFTPKRIEVEPGRFNLLVRIGSGSPILCLNAHADTVPPSGLSIPEARIESGYMHGLGSVDDKASVSAMIAALKVVIESGTQLNGTLDLLISVDEEGDANGVRTAIRDGYHCDMAITGEPTDLQIVPGHCGLVFLDIVTHGKSTHGSIPTDGINAIELMHELIDGLRHTVTDFPAHPLVGPPSMNLGILCGGDRPNRVPDRCEASVDIRLVPPVTVDNVLEKIEDYFKWWKGRAEYRITKRGGALDTSHSSPLIGSLIAASEEVRGSAPKIIGWRGWTEAEAFQSGLGIDAIVFGPGDLKQAHSADEFVDLAQVRLAARIYAETALTVLSE